MKRGLETVLQWIKLGLFCERAGIILFWILNIRRKPTLKPEQHLKEDNIAGSMWPVSVRWMCWLDNPYCAETNSTMCCARFKCLVKPRGFSIWKWLWYERSTQKHESQVKGSVLKRCREEKPPLYLKERYWHDCRQLTGVYLMKCILTDSCIWILRFSCNIINI